jgi:tetratricopeptide (TPR) repeat protein
MSRRRRGIYGQTVYYVSQAFAAVGWWCRAVVMYPVYVVSDAWRSLFGGGGSRSGRGSAGARILDALLTIPSLIWHYTYVGAGSVGDAAQSWPSVMRLRDLAAGLPALLAMLFLGLAFFVIPGSVNSDQDIVNAYQTSYRETVDEVRKTTDPKAQKPLQEKMLLYLRALSQFNPEEDGYRFGIARVYLMLGDINRGRAMLDRLAPRYDAPGFPPAHNYMAEILLDQAQANSPEIREEALAHLKQSVTKDANQPDIHLKIAAVNFGLYTDYKPQPLNPYQSPRSSYLDECEKHLQQAPKDNREVANMLGHVHALQGRKEEAVRDLGSLAADYRTVLKTKPNDMETRIRLSRAYRDIGDFKSAIVTLQEGTRLKPHPQLDFELSMTYFLMAAHQQRSDPNSLAHQYAAIRLAYVAYPSSPFVAGRFLQGFVGSTEEATAARTSLLQLLDAPEVKGTPARGMAAFLLGIDAQRRSLSVDARRYFDDARSLNDDKIPSAAADLAAAVLQNRTVMIDVATATKLYESALLIWPENPNLLIVRGWNENKHKNYATALSSLLKAVKYRPDNSEVHSMLYEAYRGLGQAQSAEKHLQLARSAKVREHEAQQARSAQPIIVPNPGPGK